MSAPAVTSTVQRLRHLRCPITGRALRLNRAWPRSEGHLLLQYLDGEATVAGQWFSDLDRLAHVARLTAAGGSPEHVGTSYEHGVVVQRQGVDRHLTHLAKVLDDPHAGLVVHRPERRAVVRLARPGATTYLKFTRSAGGAPALSLGPLRGPEVLRHEAATGMTEYRELPGRSLHGILADPSWGTADVARVFGATGGFLRDLHAATPAVKLGHHDAAAEVRVVDRWLRHGLVHAAFAPHQAKQAGRLAAQVATMLADQEAPMALVHRDLHDKQVVVAPLEEIGVLDLDTLALGDPALDLANLLVHLDLRVLQGHCGGERASAAAEALVVGYDPDEGLMARVAAYALATRVRLACVYAFRPRWSHLVSELLEGAHLPTRGGPTGGGPTRGGEAMPGPRRRTGSPCCAPSG